MSIDRRYSEKEIASIFEHAASAQRAASDHPSAREGLTLDELQMIGAEVGISPEFVTRAAAGLDDHIPAVAPETFLGLPVSASHTVDIPGRFTEDDWDRLVVDLRHTFQARGEITLDGALREWRNGNLFAMVEPTKSGARLRFGTRKVETRYAIIAGFGWFLFILMVALMKMAQNDFALDPKVLFTIMMALIGLGVAGYSASTLPSWAQTRKKQMEAIAARVLKSKGVGIQSVRHDSEAKLAAPESTLLDVPEEPGAEEENRSGAKRVRE